MYWQRSYVENNRSLGATSGTLTVDLPKSALLSDLMIRFLATNGANPNKDNPIHDAVTKIELMIDGSTVIKSLTGKEARMLAFFNAKKMPQDYDNELATDTQWMNFPIYLGRFPGDLKYGLDCGRYVNPQLKITWDTTLVGLDATSLYSTSVFPVVDVLVTQLMEGAGFPGGYIKSSRILTHTFSADGEEKRVEIPTGNVLRRLVLWCTEDVGYYLQSRLAHVMVDLNVGVRQPFKMDIEELIALQRQLYGLLTTQRAMELDSGDAARDTYLHETKYFDFQPINATHLSYAGFGGGGHLWRGELLQSISDAPAASTVWGFFTAKGDVFLGAFDLPFDYPDESFMLDTKKWTDVDLVVRAAAAGISTIAPEIGVVAEEIIP